MIILLDLNYTLALNSDDRKAMLGADYGAFVDKVERYRAWLVELVRQHHVILMTARPDRWQERTLVRIMAETGWQPNEAHFNDMGTNVAPPRLKHALLQRKVIPIHGKPDGQYLALESNAATRRMYEAQAIQAEAVPRDGTTWTELPALRPRAASLF